MKKGKLVLLEIVAGNKDLASIKKEIKSRNLIGSIKRSGKEGRFNVWIVKGYQKA